MDPYAVLGVRRDASPEEIKQAFRKLAREHHPDRNPGDDGAQKRFQEINSAYQLLSDPERRRNFDRFGTDGRSSRPGPSSSSGFPGGPSGFPSGFGGIPGGFGGFQGGFGRGFGGAVNLEDLFGEVFRGGRQQVNLDLEASVVLTFEEAALGSKKSVEYERLDHCATCSGGGCEPGTSRARCSACRGRGKVAVAAFGLFQLAAERPCPNCAGRGDIPERPCRQCSGSGVSPRRRKIEVTVPAGIEHGARQGVSGGGHRAPDGQTVGDLELLIHVQAHPTFEREGDDVLSELTVPFVTAALGGNVTVPTLHGPIPHEVPSGTQPGTELRLKGQGIPHRFRRGRGDHCVKVRVAVPTHLSPKAKELVRQLDEVLRDRSSGSMFSRIKDWF